METDVNTTVESPPASQGRWLRVIIGLGVLLTVALVAAGYLIGARFGSSPSSVGTAGAHPTKALAFVDCMRQNGVPNFPEPGPNGQFRILQADKIDMNSQAFKNAQSACQSFMPKGPVPASGAPPVVDTTAYVSCMRKNGLPDLPAPVDGTFAYDATSAKFKAAHAICKKFLPAGAPQPG